MTVGNNMQSTGTRHCITKVKRGKKGTLYMTVTVNEPGAYAPPPAVKNAAGTDRRMGNLRYSAPFDAHGHPGKRKLMKIWYEHVIKCYIHN